MTDILLCFVLDEQVTENEIILQPMNPQQRSMTDGTITKNYFPSNSDKKQNLFFNKVQRVFDNKCHD
jgi:hypothetical protein